MISSWSKEKGYDNDSIEWTLFNMIDNIPFLKLGGGYFGDFVLLSFILGIS